MKLQRIANNLIQLEEETFEKSLQQEKSLLHHYDLSIINSCHTYVRMVSEQPFHRLFLVI